METKILKVVRQGEAFSVQSSKQESGTIQKCNIVLKELGGKFENEYVCAMLGNLAMCRFNEGDLVVATMRFSTHEYQGQVFQEILATDSPDLPQGEGVPSGLRVVRETLITI